MIGHHQCFVLLPAGAVKTIGVRKYDEAEFGDVERSEETIRENSGD